MKFILLFLFNFYFQIGFSQILKITTLHKMLTNETSVSEAKKILSTSYKFLNDGGESTAGNIAYNFETKGSERNSLTFLFSTAFNTIGYIQFYDNIKQSMNYRKQFVELGFKFVDTKYSKDGSTRAFGYRKGNLLYVVELGIEKGKCKMHLSNEDY